MTGTVHSDKRALQHLKMTRRWQCWETEEAGWLQSGGNHGTGQRAESSSNSIPAMVPLVVDEHACCYLWILDCH